jgi:serine/threonine protein kinase
MTARPSHTTSFREPALEPAERAGDECVREAEASELLLVDEDGFAVTGFRPGDELPGNCLAWDRLGVGQRCETWLAWSTERWSPAVVKFPRPHQVDHPRARRTLAREVRALAANPHPALPQLFHDGSDAPRPFVVMEHIDGPSLSDDIYDNGALDPLAVTLLGTQLLAALRTVHRRGLAHVDIKPDNVVIRAGRPVLLDFGSARSIGAPQPPGRPIGSPGYAAPDLEAGAPISAAMDLYGVGTTLYEALAGQPAFRADLDAIDRTPPLTLPDGPLASVIMSLLAPEPAERPDLVTALLRIGEIAAQAGTPPWPAWLDVLGQVAEPALAKPCLTIRA